MTDDTDDRQSRARRLASRVFRWPTCPNDPAQLPGGYGVLRRPGRCVGCDAEQAPGWTRVVVAGLAQHDADAATGVPGSRVSGWACDDCLRWLPVDRPAERARHEAVMAEQHRHRRQP